MERRGRLFEAHLLEQSAANEAVVREQLELEELMGRLPTHPV